MSAARRYTVTAIAPEAVPWDSRDQLTGLLQQHCVSSVPYDNGRQPEAATGKYFLCLWDGGNIAEIRNTAMINNTAYGTVLADKPTVQPAELRRIKIGGPSG